MLLLPEAGRQGKDNGEVCLSAPDLIVSVQKCPLLWGTRIGFGVCNSLKNLAWSVS